MRTHKEKHWAHLGSEPLCLCVRSLTRSRQDCELHGFVCGVFSTVNGNRKSPLLITRGNGLYKTKRSFAAQVLNRHRSVKIFVLFTVGSR